MKSAADELTDRRPVWEVLSDMYLDTDVTLSRSHRVSVLVSSPYTIADIEWILKNEIHPVCCPNLVHIAGHWEGFDVDWLQQRILHRERSVWRWFTGYWLFNPGGTEWIATRREFERIRLSNQ